MKKNLSYLLVGVLSVSMLVGCGKKENTSSKKDKDSDKKQEKKSDITLEDLIKNMNDAAKDYDSIAVKLDANAEGSLEQGKNKMALEGSLGGSLDLDLNTFELSGDGKVKYSFDMAGNTMSDDKSVEFYTEKDGDDLTAYIGMDDEWETETITSDDIQELIEQYSSVLDADTLDENFDKMKEFYTFDGSIEEVNDKDCYEISLALNKKDIVKLIKDVEIPSGELADVDINQVISMVEEVLDDFDITMTEYVEADTYYPVQYKLSISGKGSYQGATVNVKDVSFTADIDVNNAKVKTVPSEAK